MRLQIRRHLGRHARQAPGRADGERLAGRILGDDPPAREFGRHPYGEVAVGGDEGGGGAGRLQRLAERDGGGQGFFALVGGLDHRDARHAGLGGLAPLIGGQVRPGVGGLGRAQGLGQQGRPCSALWRRLSERGDRATVEIEAAGAQEAMQDGLGMAMGDLTLRPLPRFDGVPAGLVEIEIEPGQYYRAPRQGSDGGDQLGCRRHRPCGARDDDWIRRLVAPQPRRLREDEGARTGHRIAQGAVVQDLGPVLGGDPHEIQGQAKILRVLGLHRPGDLGPGHTLHGEGVHQLFEIRGEIDRIRRRGGDDEGDIVAHGEKFAIDGLGPGLDEAGENQPAFQGRHRRGELVGAVFQQGVRGDVEFGLVRLAQRDQAWQQRTADPLRQDRGRAPAWRVAWGDRG